MAPRVTHVFFDWTNTLVRVRGSVGEIYVEHARRYGLAPVAQAIDDDFAHVIQSLPQHTTPGLTDPEIASREREWWRQVSRRSLDPFGPFPRFDEFFDDVFEFFRRREAWELLPAARETLETLRAQGRHLGIISDMDSRLYDALNALDLASFFETIALSFRVGYQKPERRLFLDALTRAGADATRAAHVGDSLTSDVEGALDAGLIAIHLDETGTSTAGGEAHVIHTLAQLPSLLTRLDTCS